MVFLLCCIDTYSKSAWIVPLKDKKSITIINKFLKKLVESGRNTNNNWADQSSKFYNRSMKSYGNGIEMYSTQNKEKIVVA